MTAQLTNKIAHSVLTGAVVACPAEAVWGLSCDPFNELAVDTLLALKHRARAKGLIVVAASEEQLAPVLNTLDAATRATLRMSWPGANTWLVPNNGVFPDWVTGHSDEIAVRVTASKPLAALCEAVGHPIISTSANPAGALPARFKFQVLRYFGPDFPCLSGAVDLNANPSTIRRANTGEVIRA